MEEDPKIELENQIELEKEVIPVPEQTLEAAIRACDICNIICCSDYIGH